MPSSFGFTFNVPRPDATAPRQPDEPFRILVIGEFSPQTEPLSQPVPVAADTLDDLMTRWQPGGRRSLEAFHPDWLLQHEPAFAALRQQRQQILEGKLPAPTPTQPASSTPAVPAEDNSALLERLLGRPSAPPQSQAQGVADNLIRQLVQPHVVSDTAPQRATALAAFDELLAAQLRAFLHETEFQSQEANWRGLDFLLRNIEVDEELQVFAVNSSRTDLRADLRPEAALEQSRLYRVLQEQPWSLVVGLFTFAPTDEDANLLAALASLAERAGVALLAGASNQFLENAATPPPSWTTMRALPAAAHVALALPRFLLRQPYGATSDPIETFKFEENSAPVQTSAYLWGNPALVCACLLAQAFRENGWEMSTSDVLEFGGLPLHVYKDNGESKMTPCAEHWLNEHAAEDLLAAGLTPLLSVRGRDAVRLLRLQSIREPLTDLTGRWC